MENVECMLPGKGEACNSCAYRIPDTYPHRYYPCRKVAIENGIMISPRIKSGICEAYRPTKPNLATVARELVKETFLVANRIGRSVHPF